MMIWQTNSKGVNEIKSGAPNRPRSYRYLERDLACVGMLCVVNAYKDREDLEFEGA